MRLPEGTWQLWALASAVFAALTAVLAKVGVAGVGSDFATLIRTGVILLVVLFVLSVTGQWQAFGSVSARSYAFLAMSGVATGLSWLSYFRALQIGRAAAVAPVDKLSVVLVAAFAAVLLGERLPPLAWLGVALVAAGAVIIAACA